MGMRLIFLLTACIACLAWALVSPESLEMSASSEALRSADTLFKEQQTEGRSRFVPVGRLSDSSREGSSVQQEALRPLNSNSLAVSLEEAGTAEEWIRITPPSFEEEPLRVTRERVMSRAKESFQAMTHRELQTRARMLRKSYLYESREAFKAKRHSGEYDIISGQGFHGYLSEEYLPPHYTDSVFRVYEGKGNRFYVVRLNYLEHSEVYDMLWNIRAAQAEMPAAKARDDLKYHQWVKAQEGRPEGR